MQDGKLAFRAVNVVYADKDKAIISEGLQSGEQVITSLLAGGSTDGRRGPRGAPTTSV